MIIDKNYFELFGLPEQYDVDRKLLRNRFRDLQKEFHPDRYSNSTDSESRAALQYSSYINEAYECLDSPLKRAQYLLLRKGIEQDHAKTMSCDSEFLLQQMAWREVLGEIRQSEHPEQTLEKLAEEITSEYEEMQREFKHSYQLGDLETAEKLVQKLQFIVKINHEIALLEDELEN